MRKKYGALLAVLAILAVVFTFVNTGAASAQAVSSTAKVSTNIVSSGSMSVAEKTVALAAAGTVHGCPLGYACIYSTLATWNRGQPEDPIYYYYGSFTIYNQIGDHYLYNNQTGGALFWLCTDWSGNTCPWYIPPQTSTAVKFNLTPINSVKLTDKNNHV